MERMDHEGCIKSRRFLDRVNEMQAELSKAAMSLHAAVNVCSAEQLALAAEQVWNIREESRRLFEQMDNARQSYL